MSVEAPAAELLQRTGNGTIPVPPVSSKLARRLQLSPTAEHDPDDYHDLQNQLDFSPLLFTSLERYLPPPVMTLPREAKANYIRDILLRYSPEGERTRVRKHREYRERLLASYKPLHRELYGFDAAKFLDPSFLEAIKGNTAESIRSIVTEVSPGVFGFQMFQPRFCEMLLDEVDNFERWVHEINIRIMRPNTMNKFGVVLDDFGLETMLNKLMDDFLSPMAGVFFPEVGGATLDSHHGFVVQYGMDRDVELGFHVDDSEVTLNACLGEKFSGGELYFKGVRCDKHVNTETQQEEMMEVGHDPGFAFLHRGRHRHGARATTSGRRANLLMWCRSSLFRELKKYRTDFSSWCGECRRIKRERHQSSMEAVKLELMKMERR